jgi:hypothetical protein
MVEEGEDLKKLPGAEARQKFSSDPSQDGPILR